jgi:hypothetical protein
MNYLAFQPAFDVFHTAFRFLRLRRLLESDHAWHFDQVRIADFYLLFPFRLNDVRLKQNHRSIRRVAQGFTKKRYENQPDDNLLFSRMRPIQRAAAETLVANGFFDEEAFKKELVIETDKVESGVLSSRIDQLNADQPQLMQALRALLEDYDLLGPDGLKARTRLLEHRYDAV